MKAILTATSTIALLVAARGPRAAIIALRGSAMESAPGGR